MTKARLAHHGPDVPRQGPAPDGVFNRRVLGSEAGIRCIENGNGEMVWGYLSKGQDVALGYRDEFGGARWYRSMKCCHNMAQMKATLRQH